MNMMKPKYVALIDKAEKGNADWVPQLRLCFQILSVSGAIDDDCAVRLSKYGLSEGKFVLLFLLRERPEGLSPYELANSAGVTRATITGLLDGLERSGLVVRHRDKIDRRGVNVCLTSDGEKLIDILFAQHIQWIGRLFDGFTDREKDLLNRLLCRIWLNTDVGGKDKKSPSGSATVQEGITDG
jgi:DNA-binding MarR family transcriptional regulator